MPLVLCFVTGKTAATAFSNKLKALVLQPAAANMEIMHGESLKFCIFGCFRFDCNYR